MNLLVRVLVIILAATSPVSAADKTAAGVWIGLIGDTTYTLELKSVSIDANRTVEELRGTLTMRSMTPGGVVSRTVAARGQFLIIEKEYVTLSFGEAGQYRDFAAGIYWKSALELALFSHRPGRPLDFRGSANFNLVENSTPAAIP